ncbi:MAG TPA: sugar phosphate isomerase/epimerase [Actinospica sp.]|nr:sugar phosphate isomerase/epimerase [Actinospica sp.]
MSGLSRRLGIFAKVFPRPTAAQVAAEVRRAGYGFAHWNFAAIGLPTLAEGIPDSTFVELRDAFEIEGIAIPSISATYNTINPDTGLRAVETRQAVDLIRRAELLGADTVILCTGSRDPHDKWTAHPDNTTPAAWHDLRATLDVLLEAASESGITLAIEPEGGTVVRDASDAARLLRELGEDAPMGIVFDMANLLTPETLNQQEKILTEAVDLLGPRIASVHAKDFDLLDYGFVVRLLESVPPVPVIVQDVTEAEAGDVYRELLSHDR